MNNRILAYVLALLANPMMLVGFPASTDAGKAFSTKWRQEATR
ncbi:MAG: hypothetical protein QGG19_13145 [Alphaproteobacteria bacterium]|jgi:hypothetical protein|nr:hypothetical protein [Alphaproteobacteria bacterium]MDP6253947.1 hypothetical protein [Alphaproteobacteria bacterium]MDP7056700.1 hypothetical protein [Alphaproteobacteria bacterium]MDP7460407.1 hypothetical protein [Alphaproteobacteria bacterium]|tara:strand:- start:14 stop:142 length:129 start_codon:yes stop_codon:yes gene_type:complete